MMQPSLHFRLRLRRLCVRVAQQTFPCMYKEPRGSWTARQNCAGDRSWFRDWTSYCPQPGWRGCALVATDVRQETAAATAAAATACGVEALGLPLDVTNYGQAQTVVQQAVQRFGRVDILVNCAGAWRVNLFVDSQPEDWTFEVNTCFMGVVHCTRAVLDGMIAQRRGKIVNIASDAGRVGEVRQAVYSGRRRQ